MEKRVYNIHALAEHLEWSTNYTYRRLREERVPKGEEGFYRWIGKKELRRVAALLAK